MTDIDILQSTMKLRLDAVHKRVLATRILDGADAEFTLALATYCLAAVEEHATGETKAVLTAAFEHARGAWLSMILVMGGEDTPADKTTNRGGVGQGRDDPGLPPKKT